MALSDSFAQSVGLPSSQRWPWDKSKGVYFIEGLHTMHCLVCAFLLFFYQTSSNCFPRLNGDLEDFSLDALDVSVLN